MCASLCQHALFAGTLHISSHFSPNFVYLYFVNRVGLGANLCTELRINDEEKIAKLNFSSSLKNPLGSELDGALNCSQTGTNAE